MRQSTLFTKTRREAPTGEVAQNAQLLIRAGYIHKEMAGVYAYLPLGLKTFQNIVGVIRDEMNSIGGQEVSLTALQDPAPWEASGRWSDDAIDVWFKTRLATGTDIGLGNTHEEPLTRAMTHHISSYKDLPAYVYQFQTKFRNELRAKSGLMRTREFVMKDLYSFSRTEDEFRTFYETAAEAYARIFRRLGIGDRTYRTFASGGAFSEFSDEFQTLSGAGEDTVYVHDGRGIAINEEVYTDEVLAKLEIDKNELREEHAIEVGNIFPLGTKYAEALDLTFTDEDGNSRPVVMGSYGIGPGRVMGAIVETFADEAGIVWPAEIAPFRLHIVSLAGDNEDVRDAAESLYQDALAAGFDVLFDDRAATAGEKFSDADLIGIPYRVVVSAQTQEAGQYELKERASGETRMVERTELFKHISL